MTFNPTIESLDYRFEDKCEQYGRFSIGPVNRGQGITIGNSLRRVLVSELTGLAITQVQFLNNSENFHEYSTIPGMRETVFEFLLNLKELVLTTNKSLDDFNSETCLLQINGLGIVTAKSIESSSVQLVDPDQYIATITSEKCKIDIEITIEKRQGSKAQLPAKNDSFESSTLPVEPKFIPVKRVNYIIEEYKTSNLARLKKERVVVEIWTDGSISPREALDQSIHQLINLFTALIKSEPKIDEPVVPTKVIPKLPKQTILIEELGLSVRSYNCLKSAQIHTVTDLLDYSRADLLQIKNFGAKSAEEVITVLQNQLGMQLPD